MVKESYTIHTFINRTRDNGWDRYRYRRIASLATYCNQLSTEQTNDIEQVAKYIMTMQAQLDSLASVVLQNQRGLDLLPNREVFAFS
jgi:hypothetical protein